MRVVIKEPGLPAEERDVANELRALQLVIGGGYLEQVGGHPRLITMCDEDGKAKRLAPNIRLPLDVLVGPVLVVGGPDDEGDLLDLTDDQVADAIHWLNTNAVEGK